MSQLRPQAGRRQASITREHSPIATIEDPIYVDPEERDIRLGDYLNDKLQILADFASLDSLIANVEKQRSQLHEQLEAAKTKLEKDEQAATVHVEMLLDQTKAFKDNQASIETTQMILVSSDAPEEAVQQLERPLEKLRRLELATSYVELLKEVDDLSSEARSHLPHDPKEALKPYTRLKQISKALQAQHEPADHAAVHLVSYVGLRVQNLWNEMKSILTDEFNVVLKKAGWPRDSNKPTEEWKACFEKLLLLQASQFVAGEEPPILLPIGVMANYFITMFRFHFMGDKETASPDKPEPMYDWVLGTFDKQRPFLYEHVGPILAQNFKGSSLAMNSLYVDPLAAFITAFLPILRQKIRLSIVAIQSQPPKVSSFMKALMNFDTNLRKEFKYDGGNPDKPWKGLTSDMCDEFEDLWLSAEMEFAVARYKEIVSAPENGQLDYDSVAPGRTKPTYGAVNVMNLLRNVTSSFQSLLRFHTKIKFVIDIQISVLDRYHNRLQDSLEVYVALTSTIGRTLHGGNKEEQAKLEGLGGLTHLCKVFGSASHIVSVLDEWSNELIFADLWRELQRRTKPKSGLNLTTSVPYEEIKKSTSSAVGTDEEGGLFDETRKAFNAIRDRSENHLIEALKYPLLSSLRPYFHKPQWLTVDTDPEGANNFSAIYVTAELDQPLQTLSTNMSFLHKTLATAVFRRIWRDILTSLQDNLWTEVLMKESFTCVGAGQFVRDISAMLAVIDKYIPNASSSEMGMLKLQEGATLLNLPNTPQNGSISFMDAFNRIFQDNDEAKLVLEELGLQMITYTDARRILERRVEGGDGANY